MLGVEFLVLKYHDSDSTLLKNCTYIASTKIAHMNQGIQDIQNVLVGTQPG